MKILLLLSLMLASFAHAKITKGDTLVVEIRGVPQAEQGQINGNYHSGKQRDYKSAILE